MKYNPYEHDFYNVEPVVPSLKFDELPAELQAFFERYHAHDHTPGTVSDELEEQYYLESRQVEAEAHAWSKTPSEPDGNITIMFRDDHRSVDIYGVFTSREAAFKAIIAEAFDVYETGLDKLLDGGMYSDKLLTVPANTMLLHAGQLKSLLKLTCGPRKPEAVA